MLDLDLHPSSTPGPRPRSADRAVGFASATTALYRAFDDVAFRADMPRCTHCVSATDVAALDAPPEQLDAALVARFVAKAGTTWGTSDDLRRVAPRALHLAAEHRLPVHRTLVLDQLARAEWAQWPPHQVDAVCRFLLAEWERLLLSAPRPGHSAHRWLRQTAGAIADLDPFLVTWRRILAAAPGPAAVHLAVLMVSSELRPDFPVSIADLFDPPASLGPDGPADAIRRTTDATGAIDGTDGTDGTEPPQAQRTDRTGLAEQLGAWLADPTTEHHLRHAEVELAHTTDARRLTLALERLRRYRAARDRTA